MCSRFRLRDSLCFAAIRLNCGLMLEPLSNSQLRKFKAAAQHLEPMFKVGKAGLSEGFVRSVAIALTQHELVKIKFVEFKDQKRELSPQLTEMTSSHLIMRVGNVMVLHRPRPETESPATPLSPKAERG